MSSINCTEFNRLLEHTVEARSSVDSAALRGHAASCADCRAAWLDALLLEGALAQWRTTGKSWPVDLADVVLFRRTAAQETATEAAPQATHETTRQDSIAAALSPLAAPALVDKRPVSSDSNGPFASPARRSRRWAGRRSAGAGAAILAVALCVAFLSGRAGRRQGDVFLVQRPGQGALAPAPANVRAPRATRQPAAASVAIAHVAPAPVPAPAPVQAMVQDAESAYLDLASEAAHAVADASLLVPRPAPASAAVQAVDENNRWVEDVGRQFEPVGKNLTQAFQFLFEAVPADKAPAT